MLPARSLTCLALLITICAISRAAVIHKPDTLTGIGTFWQITDIHWDLRYSLDGDSNKMCHVQPSTQASADQTPHQMPIVPQPPFANVEGQVYQPHKIGSPSFLVDDHSELRRDKRQVADSFISESNGISANNGNYGNYLCDSPWSLVKASLNAMVKIHPNPEFILWTGDMAPHVSDPEPQFGPIFQTISNVTRELRLRFLSDVAILPVLGNHDSFPKNNYPDCPSAFYQRYLIEGAWGEVLTPAQQDSFLKGGYYSHTASSGLTVLVINTNIYYMFNTLGTSDADPCDQFAWLRQQLETARHDGYKVLVSAHSPAGFFERLPVVPFLNVTYNEALLDMVAEYGDVMHSHVYGHLHTDTFRIMKGNNDTDSVAFLAPSLTPWQPNKLFGGTAINPSLRYYTFDSESVIDYVQYHLNLTKANREPMSAATEQHLVDGDHTTVAGYPFIAQGDALRSDRGVMIEHTQTSHDNNEMTTDANVVNADNEVTTQENVDATPVDLLHHSRDLKNYVESSSIGEDTSLNWKVYYRASEAYSLPRLNAQNMKKLYEKLETDDQLFNEYYMHNSAGIDNGPCDESCRRNHLCAIKFLHVQELMHCTKYNKTYFAELLSKTFNKISPDDYDQYFIEEAEVYHPIITNVDETHDQSVYVTENEIIANGVENSPSNLDIDLSTEKIDNDAIDIDSHTGVTFSNTVTDDVTSNSVTDDITSNSVTDDVTSNTTNPHVSDQHYLPINNDQPPATGVGLGMPVAIMIGCVGFVWLFVALLFGVVRWRRNNRYRNAATALYSNRHHSHDGYTPLYGDEH